MSKKERAARTRSGGKKKYPEPIGAAIDNLTRQLGISRKLSEHSAIAEWDALVGEQIARVTQAERMENGILFVKTATAPWRAELTMKRLEIAAKINRTLGKKVVKDIRFR